MSHHSYQFNSRPVRIATFQIKPTSNQNTDEDQDFKGLEIKKLRFMTDIPIDVYEITQLNEDKKDEYTCQLTPTSNHDGKNQFFERGVSYTGSEGFFVLPKGMQEEIKVGDEIMIN